MIFAATSHLDIDVRTITNIVLLDMPGKGDVVPLCSIHHDHAPAARQRTEFPREFDATAGLERGWDPSRAAARSDRSMSVMV
jgi:hypothetical protein